ncbi:hypothetical protein [Azospirillum sp. B2RO_4]|uniref:hypothetical protein n=1 Tax=Azospirillum sp. B2RO_4 TaxID=3027796 RepID=UPI003DAA0501
MKKAKKQKPVRRKRTRAETKTIRHAAGVDPLLSDVGMSASMKKFRRYLLAADAAHWKGESPDDRWVYDQVLDRALNEDTLMFLPVPIHLLEEEAQRFSHEYDPDDPDAIEPLKEPIDVLVGRLVERGLVTFDTASGMVSIVPLRETEGA